MKKDIDFPEVEDVAVAIAKEDKNGEEQYNVYLLNLGKQDIKNVLVSSEGYGVKPGTEEKVSTSILRHFLEDVNSDEAKLIEPIMPDLFHLNNQYWVSFQKDGKTFDKKYIFVAGSVDEQFFSKLPIINAVGVIIQ